MKKLICITGKDGTGKSTQIELLKKKYPDAYISEIWDLLDSSQNKLKFASKKEIDEYLCGLTPNSRLLFLMHALKFSVDKAMSSNACIIILNAYHYKYLASEIALGADKQLAQALAKSFPVPDFVIELRLESDIAAKRKQRFSRYECGAGDTVSKNLFIDFQEQIILNPHKHENWCVIDGNLKPDEIFDKILMTVGF